MELWIGPVIVAAAVSALVSVAGWFVTSWQTLRQDRLRREEKVHDFQVALRAEIASDLLNLAAVDRTTLLSDVRERLLSEPGYSAFVPHLAVNVVFEAIVDQIYVLPGEVITPVIHYARLRQTIARFIDDLRSEATSRLPAERRLLMLTDYYDMLARLETLTRDALAALDQSLGVNNSALAPPTPASSVALGGGGEASSVRASST